MRTKNSSWYEVKAKYEKVDENNISKKVSEIYLVESISCSDAEQKASEILLKTISGEFEVKSVVQPDYTEVIFSERNDAEKYYKVKTRVTILDESTGKEKIATTINLVQATDIRHALGYMDSLIQCTGGEYTAIQETKIIDVFEKE